MAISYETYQKLVPYEMTSCVRFFIFQAFGVSVCNLTTTDLLNLGAIGEAVTTSQISCLPLQEDDDVASFGAIPAWTTDQVRINLRQFNVQLHIFITSFIIRYDIWY